MALTLEQLTELVEQQSARIKHLEAAEEGRRLAYNTTPPMTGTPTTSRRRMLGKLAVALVAGVGVNGVLSGGAEAKLIINPTDQAGRIGAIIMRNGGSGTIIGALPDIFTFGLVATNSQSLDLSQVGSGDSGVVGLSSGGNGVTGQSANAGASGVYGVNSAGGFGVAGRSNLNGNGIGVLGEAALGNGVVGGGFIGVVGTGTGYGSTGVSGIGIGTGNSSTGVSGTGFTGVFGSGNTGVSGTGFTGVSGTGTNGNNSTGVSGLGYGANSTGVYGFANGANSYAGYFLGNVTLTGTLTKPGGSFKIDHPVDPANKYLSHSFVESPDMMNIYNGVISLDGQGQAEIEMPGWFETLNRDFRYQLTALGSSSPDLYIADEVKGGQFKIAGGKAGQRVSWQVTGIRQDKWANAHRIPVEEAKPEGEKGFYLHPTLYGATEEQRVGPKSPATVSQSPVVGT